MHLARLTTLSAAVVAALAGTALPAAAQHSAPGPTRAGVATDGRQADGASAGPVLSANGRYIAFVSTAANPVRGDTNGLADVFVKDLRTGAVERVSVAADGTEADQPTVGSTSLSDHRVAFSSMATDLVRGDTYDTAAVFVVARTH